MMTEAQIEAAARELCRLRGEDPDARAWSLGSVNREVPLWETVAKQVRDHDRLDTAVRVGREAKP